MNQTQVKHLKMRLTSMMLTAIHTETAAAQKFEKFEEELEEYLEGLSHAKFVEQIRLGKLILRDKEKGSSGNNYLHKTSFMRPGDGAVFSAQEVAYKKRQAANKVASAELERIIDKLVFTDAVDAAKIMADFAKTLAKLGV